YCESLGAKGCINRKDFDHWGMLPHWKDEEAYGQWFAGVKKFGKAFWEGLIHWIKETLVSENKISPEDLDSFYLVDSQAEVIECLSKFYAQDNFKPNF
ncbi:MAG: hypothetical protein VW710_07640, partial [Flavobacteriaceae bacterium]